MAKHTDSLRGYSFDTHCRDDFTCIYCGADGNKSFETWLTLSRDHLLPQGHPQRDNPDYIVTACQFCNTADNHYFERAQKEGFSFDGLTPEQLIKRRKLCVMKTREDYRAFWDKKVNM